MIRSDRSLMNALKKLAAGGQFGVFMDYTGSPGIPIA